MIDPSDAFDRMFKAARDLPKPNARTDRDVGAEHQRAWDNPRDSTELSIKNLMLGLADYAYAHAKRYDSPLGEDAVLGDAWLGAWRGVRAMLNGETGRLDGGLLDSCLLEMARLAGFSDEEIGR